MLVAIDGVDGAGKTVFADALAEYLRVLDNQVQRVSLDNFHQPRDVRYRLGSTSPEGFWLDSYDYRLLDDYVFSGLAAEGTGWFREAGHDLDSDERLSPPATFAPPGSITIVDGMFLHRKEVRQRWDYSVFLAVPFRVTAERMAKRDGTPADPEHPAMQRYVGGQRLYLDACAPGSRATLLVDNTDPRVPVVVRSEGDLPQ